MTKILVTGGAGYLGSHTCVELLNQDYQLVVVDNLLHSSFKSLTAIKEITGKDFTFYQADIREVLKPFLKRKPLLRSSISQDLKL